MSARALLRSITGMLEYCMSINISGPFRRVSLEHRGRIRGAGCLGTCLAAWVTIGCSGTSASPGGDTGQGGSNVGGTSAAATGGTPSNQSTGGASQSATGGNPATGGTSSGGTPSGGAPATGGRQTGGS